MINIGNISFYRLFLAERQTVASFKWKAAVSWVFNRSLGRYDFTYAMFQIGSWNESKI